MSKFKTLESTTLIVDNNSHINVEEELDGKFKIKIEDQYSSLLIGIPYKYDVSSTLFVSFNEAIKILQEHYMCKKV